MERRRPGAIPTTEALLKKDGAPRLIEKETVRAVVMNSTGQILLLQKDSTSKTQYKWELPGGGVDLPIPATPDQLLSELVREIGEETKLAIDQNNFVRSIGSFEYVRKNKGIKSPTIVHAYAVLLNEGQSAQGIVIDPGDKHRAFKWADATELVKMQRAGKISSNTSRVTEHISTKRSILQRKA